MAKPTVAIEPENYEFLSINQDMLDMEWIKQPTHFFKWATKLADARLKLEGLKSELDVVTAEMSRSIRDNPSDYGIAKLTEPAVTAAIPEQEEYQDKVKEINKAKHRVDIVQAVVSALDHKKRALEKLVDLHGQNYFSTPRASSSGKEGMEEGMKRVARKKGRSQDDEDDI